MRSPTPPSNPIDVARESLRMDKETGGDRTFRMVAIGMMAVTALATAAHAFHGLWRDMRGRREGREYGHGDRRSYSGPDEPEYRAYERGGALTRHDDADQERNWSRREERRGRSPEDDEGWAEHSHREGRGRQR